MPGGRLLPQLSGCAVFCSSQPAQAPGMSVRSSFSPRRYGCRLHARLSGQLPYACNASFFQATYIRSAKGIPKPRSRLLFLCRHCLSHHVSVPYITSSGSAVMRCSGSTSGFPFPSSPAYVDGPLHSVSPPHPLLIFIISHKDNQNNDYPQRYLLQPSRCFLVELHVLGYKHFIHQPIF